MRNGGFLEVGIKGQDYDDPKYVIENQQKRFKDVKLVETVIRSFQLKKPHFIFSKNKNHIFLHNFSLIFH
jgi:hypothetical protein